MTDVVELTQALCTIPSITGDEAAVCDDMAARLRKLTPRVTTQNVRGPDGKAIVGRDNLLALSGDAPPQILLTTHLDTVPPFLPPKLEGDQLVGRGVIDAKGIAAAMVCAWEKLLAAGETRVGLLFVVGEETDSDGAKAAASGFAPQVQFVVDGEPTDGTLVRAMKGVLAFELAVQGKAAHSAYPEAGKSALHQLIGDLARLQSEAWPDDADLGATTLNIGTVNGGVAANVLAPFANAVCVLRTTADADVLEQRVRSLLSSTTEIKVRTKSSPSHLVTLPGEATKVVAFGSDVPHLAPLGRSLLFGPGSILDAHTSHEHVAVADLHKAVDAYVAVSLRLLRGDA
ncbi:MAG TPA: M20/M25/M40 family metallo-hydrolase [Myxococcota bacterium]